MSSSHRDSGDALAALERARRAQESRQQKHDVQLRLGLKPGMVFRTAHEQGCVVVTEPNDQGEFRALDTDGVECAYSIEMIEGVN